MHPRIKLSPMRMKQRIDVLIVDDDPVCRKTLSSYLENQCSSLRVSGEADNVELAQQLIQRHRPDVVFLDVNLGGENGLSLLDRVKERTFMTVFYSLDKRNAVEAFRNDAIYFLEKPLSIDDLNQCISKIQVGFKEKQDRFLPESRRKLEVFASGRTHYIPLYDIAMIEASGAYSIVHRDSGQRLVVSRNIKSFEIELGEQLFYRIHNSYLVNVSKIATCSFIQKRCVLDSGREVKMAVRRTVELRKKLEYLWGNGRTSAESDRSSYNG